MYTFVARDEGSSVYTAVRNLLLTEYRDHWTLLDKDSMHFNVMFADRNKWPSDRLGQQVGTKQLVNYYRGAKLLCRKTQLVKTLLASSTKESLHWLPLTFIIYPQKPSVFDHHENTKSLDLKQLKLRAQRQKDQRDPFQRAWTYEKENSRGQVWIAKSTSGAKGEGIKISDNPSELLEYIDQQEQVHVVQKYIEQPMLLPGDRKFDIRCWVLLDHNYNIYLYKEGVLRTASEPYDMSDLKYTTCHLTNHCIQKELSSNYGKYEEGNEMFFKDFASFLHDKHQTSLEDKLIPQIEEIVKQCLLTVKGNLVTTDLNYDSFQLFGFDFLVDQQCKVWLLEINGSPASAAKLLDGIARSIITLAIEPLFPCEGKAENKSNFIKLV